PSTAFQKSVVFFRRAKRLLGAAARAVLGGAAASGVLTAIARDLEMLASAVAIAGHARVLAGSEVCPHGVARAGVERVDEALGVVELAMHDVIRGELGHAGVV